MGIRLHMVGNTALDHQLTESFPNLLNTTFP
ncbi:hypothetical protein N826_30885 [Skermanella aerolata KACC 11604]|nr:hypothetical protein N826_30885 [Skermanella aerolata KACC 11604]